MLFTTLTEPQKDVDAQISALLDPSHPKDAVFLALSNEVPANLPAHVHVIHRGDGVLLTTDERKASFFKHAEELAESDMAKLLGYPESKDDVAAREGEPTIVQVRNETGAVVVEAAASSARVAETFLALTKQKPQGGTIVFLTVMDALLRRAQMRLTEMMI